MFRMYRVNQAILVLVGLLLANSALADCPAFLDHEMRRLHSSEQVNFCSESIGKPMLIVNTASHCGFTPQFKGLQAVHEKYAARGLQVVGFASDDFQQEAKTEEEAATICYKNFGVTFTMVAPSHVRGDNANPVFAELARQTQAPDWNFNKYLVDRYGKVTAHFGRSADPLSEQMRQAIESVL